MSVIGAGVAALTIIGTLAGCGGSDTEVTKDDSGATVIKFGINVANPAKQEPATNDIVEAFNKANKGKYKVEFVAADTESHAKNMKLAASDGTLPQVFWVEGSQVTEQRCQRCAEWFRGRVPGRQRGPVWIAVPEQCAGHLLQQGCFR